MDPRQVTQLEIGDPETRVRLVAQGKNLWKVRMLFPRARAHEIPEQLRQIKADLARSFGVAEHRLQYYEMISKRRMRHGILVEIQIRRQEAPAGAMRIRFLPKTAQDGTVFSDMRVVVDLFPVDEYDCPLTIETVDAKLRSEGVDVNLVRWRLVRELVDDCVERQSPMFEQVIAEGELPDIGMSSRTFYHWFPQSDPAHTTAWLGLRKVEQGEGFLEHQPATTGLHSGRNIFGKELSPRRGTNTRLVRGPGVSSEQTERKMVATKAGVLFFRRSYADKRQKDSPCAVPHVLTAEVMRIRELKAVEAPMQKWDEPVWILGTLPKGSVLTVAADCVLQGDISSGCQIQVSGDLRVTGHVADATIGTGGHFCVHGDLRGAICEVGLTAQFIGRAVDCTVYAREILADKIEGGIAEAYHQFSNKHEVVAFNREKFLAEHRRAGEEALTTLQRQMTRLYEIFGPEIVQQVTDDTIQMNLLRWLKRQKALGIGTYSHAHVQEFRTLLEVLPGLRRELASIAAGLREPARPADKQG